MYAKGVYKDPWFYPLNQKMDTYKEPRFTKVNVGGKDVVFVNATSY